MAMSMKDSPSNMPDNIRIVCHFGIRWNDRKTVIVAGIHSTLECNFFKTLEIRGFRLKI